ncbi:hypothetical protein Q5752_001040 [Cryptotrichosporon argae]
MQAPPESPVESTGADLEKQPAPPAPVPAPAASVPDGGLQAWACLAGSWLVLFATFGMANTFGVFQSYYTYTLYPDVDSSTISWVGSVQLFFQFSLGAVAGPLYDRGKFRWLVYSGCIIYIVCWFMTSLCKQFWQTMLAQGIGCGIGIGILFLPALSILSQFFMRRRAFAMGIAVTGSSIGGICLPIMLNNLITRHGFEKAVQYTGYLLIGVLALACALMHPRLGANAHKQPPPSPKELFQSRPYAVAVAGLCFVMWGLFYPIFYIQVYGEAHGISDSLTFYTLAILNAASVVGRTTPNFLADKIGSLNLITGFCLCAGAMCFAVLGAGTPGGLVVVAILFGFFSGAYVSLMSPSLIAFARGFHEIGIRIGLAMLCASLFALSGTPICGALLDRYGFVAPTVFSGVTVLAGSALLATATLLQRRAKGTWKV